MVWALRRLGRRSYRPTGQDTLVSSGIYRHIRHPIYSGLLIEFVALALQRPTKPAITACALGWGYTYVQARLEEIDLQQRVLGYRVYMENVPRFFPRFWPRKK
jgi:protein-S-isoprenylcysteine O-methyltransferase Ste14